MELQSWNFTVIIIGIGKYLSVCQNFSAKSVWGGAQRSLVYMGPPNISETTRARKLNLDILLDMVKYPLYQKFSARGV